MKLIECINLKFGAIVANANILFNESSVNDSAIFSTDVAEISLTSITILAIAAN
ncbi:hypothetical protein [Prevotella denticola]|uniref:hypothetical protein n=1 Tax=Prevotella denticola TaxID=28129 RepID=UPI0024323BEA|nr:hypothetical protein [Prevotella denticola]